MDKDNKNVWNLVVISIGIIAAVIASLIIAKDIIFKGSNTHKLSSVYKYTIATNEKAVELDNMYVKLESYIYSQKFGIGYCIFDVKLKNKESVKVRNRMLYTENSLYSEGISDGKNKYNIEFWGSGFEKTEYKQTDTGYKVYVNFGVYEYQKGKEDTVYIMSENDDNENFKNRHFDQINEDIKYTLSYSLSDQIKSTKKITTKNSILDINLLGANSSGIIHDFTIVYKNGDKHEIMSNRDLKGKNFATSHNVKYNIIFEKPCEVKNIDYILVDGVKYK